MLRLSTSPAIKKAVAARRPYHRVNLKQSLLDSAVALIGDVGPQAFTLREVARRAGVSHNAPYRHFRDRDDLLANIALRGFEQFAVALAQAWDEGRPDPLTALDRMGKSIGEPRVHRDSNGRYAR